MVTVTSSHLELDDGNSGSGATGAGGILTSSGVVVSGVLSAAPRVLGLEALASVGGGVGNSLAGGGAGGGPKELLNVVLMLGREP